MLAMSYGGRQMRTSIGQNLVQALTRMTRVLLITAMLEIDWFDKQEAGLVQWRASLLPVKV
jgi:hypothetical protein